jgi:hypothetical protein
MLDEAEHNPIVIDDEDPSYSAIVTGDDVSEAP